MSALPPTAEPATKGNYPGPSTRVRSLEGGASAMCRRIWDLLDVGGRLHFGATVLQLIWGAFFGGGTLTFVWAAIEGRSPLDVWVLAVVVGAAFAVITFV